MIQQIRETAKTFGGDSSITTTHPPKLNRSAERDAVMLGTLPEETTGGCCEEQAVTGEGEHSTLVTMICQLLSPRLEAIDEGAEDIQSRLPL